MFHTLVASSCKVLSGMTHIQLLKEIYLFPMLPSLILYIQARPNNIRHTVLKATNLSFTSAIVHTHMHMTVVVHSVGPSERHRIQ